MWLPESTFLPLLREVNRVVPPGPFLRILRHFVRVPLGGVCPPAFGFGCEIRAKQVTCAGVREGRVVGSVSLIRGQLRILPDLAQICSAETDDVG